MRRDEQAGAGDEHFLSTCLTQGLQSGDLIQCSKILGPTGLGLHSTVRQGSIWDSNPDQLHFTEPPVEVGGGEYRGCWIDAGFNPSPAFSILCNASLSLRTLSAFAFSGLNFYVL